LKWPCGAPVPLDSNCGANRTPTAHRASLLTEQPRGKGNIGASYLDVPGSLAALLRRLREEGYNTGDAAPSAAELLQLLERGGRNIEQWAPGELDALVAAGQAVLIPVKQYRQWLRETPKAFQDSVLRNWGPPERSELMTIRSRDGEAVCVLPALRFGNVFVGPQPLRSSFALAGQTLHDTTIPPPHCYVAGYLWLRHVFKADAITHIGRHGTLEFLPGKNVGMAGWDPAEVLVGDTPAPYVYIIDGGGESTTARRRGMSTLIGHLTPLLAAAGEQDEFRPLREAFLQMEKVRDTSPGLLAEYEAAARKEIRRLRLDAQLGIDLDRLPWEEAVQQVESFLEETEAGPIPMGIHELGRRPPRGPDRVAGRVSVSKRLAQEPILAPRRKPSLGMGARDRRRRAAASGWPVDRSAAGTHRRPACRRRPVARQPSPVGRPRTGQLYPGARRRVSGERIVGRSTPLAGLAAERPQPARFRPIADTHPRRLRTGPQARRRSAPAPARTHRQDS
jgi:cobalamin biosynthesis Mg chelatase CobN